MTDVNLCVCESARWRCCRRSERERNMQYAAFSLCSLSFCAHNISSDVISLFIFTSLEFYILIWLAISHWNRFGSSLLSALSLSRGAPGKQQMFHGFGTIVHGESYYSIHHCYVGERESKTECEWSAQRSTWIWLFFVARSELWLLSLAAVLCCFCLLLLCCNGECTSIRTKRWPFGTKVDVC